MAKIELTGLDEYIAKMNSLGRDVEGIIKRAVYPAAGMLADAIVDAAPELSGDLKESVGIAKYQNESGYVFTTILFDGYDHNGVPNDLKANALEHGRSSPSGGIVGKHPFIRPTVTRIREMLIGRIQDDFIKYCEEKMNN